MTAQSIRTAAEEANSAWEVYRYEHAPRGDYPPDMMLELSEAYAAGFKSGVRYAVVATSQFSTVLGRLDSFLSWIRTA